MHHSIEKSRKEKIAPIYDENQSRAMASKLFDCVASEYEPTFEASRTAFLVRRNPNPNLREIYDAFDVSNEFCLLSRSEMEFWQLMGVAGLVHAWR